MVHRLLVWFGTGVITAGVSAAVLAGAGVAMATDGAASDGNGSKTSESSDNTGTKNESGARQTSATGPNDDAGDKKGDLAGDAKDADAKDEDVKDEDVKDEITDGDAKDEITDGDVKDEITGEDAKDANEEVGELVDSADGTGIGTGPHSNDGQENESQTQQLNATVVDDLDSAAKITGEDVEKKDALIGTELGAGDEHAVVTLQTEFEELTEQDDAPEFAAMAFSSPAAAEVNAMATATPLNLLLDLVGTIVFGLYGLVTQLIGGPPMLPANSTVTVFSSRLRIDCGCAPGEGEEVPVDWYIPENPNPERLIYLQHGFLAAGPWYSHTAAALAEQTNSIVVAPSITSNFLAYDQCWLGGAPMHQAMAELFKDGNTALADSLGSTDYQKELKWSEVVLMGHSLGGGAVSGIAGYMTENGTADRLAGVVLLDGVGLNGEMVNDLRKMYEFDKSIPIYQLAAPRYMWNMFGSGTDALVEARPDADFYGVTLVGGSHVDTMRGGNFLIQFAQQLVSGFSEPQNVAAAEMLMVGWVNDMFAGNQGEDREGIYLAPGETRSIETPEGQATLVDLPNSLRKPFILNFLEPFLALSSGLFTLQPGCLRESTGTAASCTDSVAA